MRSAPILLLFSLCGISLCVVPAAAQELRVVGDGVRLRAGASKFNRILRVLENGEALALVHTDSLRDGFFHVRADTLEGWVHESLVERAVAQHLAGTPVLPTILDAKNPAPTISSTWEKPPLVRTTFRNGKDKCGPFGSSGDRVTNEQKNRADVPTVYHAVTFDAIGDTTRLRFPHHAPTSRVRWTAAQTAFVTPFEGIPVAVVGYIRVIRPQASHRESANCSLTREANTDWHITLVRGFDDRESRAVVVEPTPRIKQLHVGRWTRTRLRRYENPQSPGDSVRISGYLLMDPAHPGHLGSLRGTLWEIHPVTRIEVFRDGQWRDLDEEP